MNNTKEAIAAALKRLLLKKPITRITINDIAEDCHISRMTFYYHFRDIYDLLEWICEEDARAAMSENRTLDTWQTGFQSLLELVRANKPFILNIFRSVDRAQIEQYLARVTERLLLAVIDEQAEGVSISDKNKRYIASFFTYGFIGIMFEWIRHDMQEEPKQIAEIIGKILQGDFGLAIERLMENP